MVCVDQLSVADDLGSDIEVALCSADNVDDPQAAAQHGYCGSQAQSTCMTRDMLSLQLAGFEPTTPLSSSRQGLRGLR